MKSTYRLIGTHWDHIPDDVAPYNIINANLEGILPLGWPRCLFDSEQLVRVVQMSQLIATNDLQELDEIVDESSNCDTLLLWLDFEPKSKGLIPQAYYQAKTKQVIGYLTFKLTQTAVIVVKAVVE